MELSRLDSRRSARSDRSDRSPRSDLSAVDLAGRLDADALVDDLTAASAAICPDLVVLLLHHPSTGTLRPVRLHHRDARRAEVLMARLTGEGRTDDTRPGTPHALPVDAASLPEPVRAVLAEELPAGALVVPVTGRLGPCGVLVAGRRHGVEDADVGRLIALGRRFGERLELVRYAEDSLRERALIESLPDAVIAVDRDDRVTHWNAGAARLFGVEAVQAVGSHQKDLLRSVFREFDAHTVYTRLRADGSWHGRVHHTSRTGRAVECEVHLAQLPGTGPADGLPRGVVGVHRPVVTARRPDSRPDSEEPPPTVTAPPSAPLSGRPSTKPFTRGSARPATNPAADLVAAVTGPAAALDAAGRVTAVNEEWQAAVGSAPRDGCGPVPAGRSWLRALRTSQRPEPRVLADRVAQLLTGTRTAAVEAECRCAGTDRAPTRIQVVRLGDAGALVLLAPPAQGGPGMDDMTFRATHDELTGLPNRAKLMTELSTLLKKLGDPDGAGKLAVLFCDLDGFKDINDGLGHAVGDQVLVAVARRLRQRCRSADVLARFGGDEFVVVLSVTQVQQAVAMADRIVEVLAEPIVVGEAEVAPGVSVGITVVDVPPDGEDPVGTLLRDADTAMYHAKGRGRGRHELFDASLRDNIEERLELAAALHRAVGEDQLELVFQGRRRCGDRALAGVEALLRWRHPTLGLLPPEQFIPIAEHTGRINDLGEWAIGRALEAFAGVADPRATLAVNVSARQLAGGRLARAVAASLARTGVDPSRLVLEITESAFVDDPQVARDVLADLRALGVAIALDDFGTGWSSLSYLRTLPVDIIKIDRTFVADLPTDLDACAVVSAVIQLGHGMGLVVVAEGVENEDHLSVLRDMGCDEYQGFIDGRPGPIERAIGVTGR